MVDLKVASKTFRKSLHIFFFSMFIAIVFVGSIYIVRIHQINKEYYQEVNKETEVVLRKFPYPYKAAMTICSDIDRTETLVEFLEIQKFLNSREMTSIGEGVGLDIGNSFLFYETPTSSISFFNSGSEVAQTILEFIKSGRIDVMHSFGKKNDFTRKDAVKALNELKRNDVKVNVWIDHDKTINNLGDDVTFGLGDHPNAKEFHSDLTLAYGVKFVWLGRVTMITGQSSPITIKTFTGIFDYKYPIYSLVNISKEFVKNVVAIFGSKKYAMHKNNDLVTISKLDDGQKVYEFMRFDNHWQGVSRGANSKGLAYVISPRTLSRLKEVGGYMIVYTHLGMNSDCPQYICVETQNALRNLAKEFEDGNIYVTTTSKLLNYYVNHKYLDWSYDSKEGVISIYIHGVKDLIFGSFAPTIQELEGITFYVPDKNKAKIYLSGKRLENVKKNPADHTKRESLTITAK